MRSPNPRNLPPPPPHRPNQRNHRRHLPNPQTPLGPQMRHLQKIQPKSEKGRLYPMRKRQMRTRISRYLCL